MFCFCFCFFTNTFLTQLYFDWSFFWNCFAIYKIMGRLKELWFFFFFQILKKNNGQVSRFFKVGRIMAANKQFLGLGCTVKTMGSKSVPKRVIFDPTSWVNYAPTKKGSFLTPSALVMNLTQIVGENDCIWGQSDHSRSQMNDSFWVKKWLLSGLKQGNDPGTGL